MYHDIALEQSTPKCFDYQGDTFTHRWAKKQTLRYFGSLTLELGHVPVENELIASFPKSHRGEGVTTIQ